MERGGICLDSGGLFLEPKLEKAILYGLVLDRSQLLTLFLELPNGKLLTMFVPQVTRLFLSPDLRTGTGFEPRTELFEMVYAPVTEETVISVTENLEMMGANVEGIERVVRSASFALEWITIKGSNGLALSESAPDSVSWAYESRV